MKERRGLGHDDEINLQVGIAKGLALLLQRMPRKPMLRGQEASLRLRRRERPPHEEPARPKDLQGHLRRGCRQNRLRRLRRRGEGAAPAFRVRRIAEGHLLREDRQEARLRRLPKRQGAPAAQMRQVQPQIRLFREEDGDVRQESRSQGHQAS